MNAALAVWPGFRIFKCPFMGIPKRVKSPITSKSLCLAGSLSKRSSKLFKIPCFCILISVFPNKSIADKAAKAVEKNRIEAAKLMKMEFNEGEVVFSQNSLTQE